MPSSLQLGSKPPIMASPEELVAKATKSGAAPSADGVEVVDAGLQELRDAIAGRFTVTTAPVPAYALTAG